MQLASYQELLSYLALLTDEQFIQAPAGKWSPGQQAMHLIKSVKPVALAFGLPGWMPILLFGKSQKGSRSFDVIVATYQGRLSGGAKAGKPYIPKAVTAAERQSILDELEKVVHTLEQRIHHRSQSQLDTLRLPHPILGKITFQEMIHFTSYHAHHHLQSIKKIIEP